MKPLVDLPSKWEPTPVSKLPSPSSLWDAHMVSIDLETCDPQLHLLGPGVRRGGFIAGVAFAVQGGPSWYFPVAHENDPSNDERYMSWLIEFGRGFHGRLVNARIDYDLDFLEEAGVTFPVVESIRDVLIADPLINQNEFRYGLDVVTSRWLPGLQKEERHLRRAAEQWGVDPKKELWKLPARHVAEYALQDTRLAMAVYAKQGVELDRQHLWDVFNLESALTPVLVKMRRRGVRVDFDQVERVETWLQKRELEALAEVRHRTGVEVDVNLSETIGAAVKYLGMPYLTKQSPKKKIQSWDKEVLLSVNHDVSKLILKAKKFNKIRTTFLASYRRYAIKDRLHCTYNQIRCEREDGDLAGVGFGRLSCQDPNLTQTPGRDELLGPLLRSVIVPEEGEQWAALDFSGQEPRWIIHYAEKTRCIGAKEMAEAYRAKPDLDLHQKTADLAGIKRKEAKTIFLGLAYGMGAVKLCVSLGLPLLSQEDPKEFQRRMKQAREEHPNFMPKDFPGKAGTELLARFNEMVPFLKQLQRKATRKAEESYEVRTALGRACKFEKQVRGGGGQTERAVFAHKALNRVIQGSSADQSKKALVDADRAGIPVQLQVHDEIDLSVPNEKMAQQLQEIMVNSIPMSIPILVDVELGKSWGDSMREANRSRELSKWNW